MAFLKIENLTKKFGGLIANSDISIEILQGEIVGIIGPNGAGKSTFFATVSGFYKPDGGAIIFRDEEIGGKPPETICQLGIARTFQIVRPLGLLSVLDNILVGAFLRDKNRKTAREKAEAIMEFTGLKNLRDKLSNSLTIADKKRLELARAIATQPELLMLDEVMAGLTPKETQEAVELIKKINRAGITLLVVEHVMEVVMPISHRIMVLDGGKKIAEGTPEEVANNEDVIKAYLGEKYNAASF
ncbi:MAG: ABC transporter ATP-binding protein [Acidaminococcales bacterium]|jgi:branched-chain amino acid transport system ATP-binding protein|nr:ABC transporter ATP-binding protein [Acidaminococcales bacterium]